MSTAHTNIQMILDTVPSPDVAALRASPGTWKLYPTCAGSPPPMTSWARQTRRSAKLTVGAGRYSQQPHVGRNPESVDLQLIANFCPADRLKAGRTPRLPPNPCHLSPGADAIWVTRHPALARIRPREITDLTVAHEHTWEWQIRVGDQARANTRTLSSTGIIDARPNWMRWLMSL
jgi:hypothetical protein